MAKYGTGIGNTANTDRARGARRRRLFNVAFRLIKHPNGLCLLEGYAANTSPKE